MGCETQESSGRILSDIIIGTAFVVLAFVALVCYALRFTKEPRSGLVFPSDAYDTLPMQQAMRPDMLEKRQEQILNLGSRFLGQPGFYAAEEFMEKAYKDAGLEILTQDLLSTVPVTRQREISIIRTGPDGFPEDVPIPDVEVYPFMPNYLQPSVTPEEGITGELILLTPETLNTRGQFDDCIGLLDVRQAQIDKRYEFRWTTYARLGIKALIVSHPDGFEQVPWISVAGRDGIKRSC